MDRAHLPHDIFQVGPRLYAGPYPSAKDHGAALAKLRDYLDLGITCFIDLTEEDEGLRLYGKDLRDLAAETGRTVTHLRFSILDGHIGPEWMMRAAQNAIEEALTAGETVYVHCWGGVGRTGTVIACHLMGRDGLTGQQAITELRRLRTGLQREHRRVPETDIQHELVHGWKPGQ